MKVLDLHCAHTHSFEGWFASEDDFQDQLARGLLECPVCGDNAIAKLPKGRTAVEETAVEAAANVNADFKIKLSYLSLIAGVGPMIGLFGTMSGMIGAFNSMAYGGATGDPTKLAGDIGEALGVPGATLSFHLKELVHAGLVEGESQGRYVCYRANFQAMNGLIEYLTHNCCAGSGDAECAPVTDSACGC